MINNWEVKKLGEVCELITKGTTPTSLGYRFTESGVGFIKVESLTESGEIIPSKVAHISKECHDALKRSQLKEGDILFSIAGALGRIGIVSKETIPANTNQALAIIRLPEKAPIEISFLARYFTSHIVTEQIKELKGGVAQQNLSLGQLKNLYVPIPSIIEQKRIVKMLDEKFEAIEKLKKVTEEQIKDVEDLRLSTVVNTFSNQNNWKSEPLNKVCVELFAGGDVPKGNHSKKKSEKYQVPIYANGEKNKGLYGYTDKPRVTKPSITISARGTIGYSEIRYEPFYPVVRLIVATPDTQKVSLEYLQYVIKTLDFVHSGSSIPQLTIPMLKDYAVFYPDLKLQRAIVKELDALSVKTEELKRLHQTKLESLKELKKSYLEQAFAGKL